MSLSFNLGGLHETRFQPLLLSAQWWTISWSLRFFSDFPPPKKNIEHDVFFGGEDGDSVVGKSSSWGSMIDVDVFFYRSLGWLGGLEPVVVASFNRHVAKPEVLFHTQQGLQAGTTYGFMVGVSDLLSSAGYRVIGWTIPSYGKCLGTGPL